MQVDSAIPKLTPEGHYIFEIVADPEKKPSTFGKGFYYEIKFFVKDENGEHWDFIGIFTQRQEKYHDLLIALGGTRDKRGMTHLSDTNFIGKKFEADIIQRRAKNDQNKMVNDIINIKPIQQLNSSSNQDSSQQTGEDENSGGEKIPF